MKVPDDDLFDRIIAETCERIPEHLRARIRNVAFVIEDEPSEEVRQREGLGSNETLLGYYHGIPQTERGDGYGMGAVLPDVITLYRVPIYEASAGDKKRLEDIIRDTTLHEIAHYFGMNEEEVEAWEYRGRTPQAHLPGGHLFRKHTGT